MITLFSSQDIKKLAEEIKRRQDEEDDRWVDENNEKHKLPFNHMRAEKACYGIDLFVEELCRRFPTDERNDCEIGYFSDDTPRLTKK